MLTNPLLQIDFLLSDSTVVFNVKKDYYCLMNGETIVDEGSLSFKQLPSEFTDKMAYITTVALPAVVEDAT